MPLKPIDWEKPLVTNETPPRKATVIGAAHSVIDFMLVRIDGPSYHHPAGEYAACKNGGLIRGNLAIRNVNS